MKRRQFICSAVVASILPTLAVAQGTTVVVQKDPECPCCEAWAEAFEDAGYQVQVQSVENIDAVKEKLAIPADVWGCHTATVDGYYLEGLGMGSDRAASYDVMAVPTNGSKPYVYFEVRPS